MKKLDKPRKAARDLCIISLVMIFVSVIFMEVTIVFNSLKADLLFEFFLVTGNTLLICSLLIVINNNITRGK